MKKFLAIAIVLVFFIAFLPAVSSADAVCAEPESFPLLNPIEEQRGTVTVGNDNANMYVVFSGIDSWFIKSDYLRGAMRLDKKK